MTTDSELLRQYAEQGVEAAFAEVVRRHADWVYSAALRIVRDAALAQDVTQTVFTQLARVARVLGRYPTPIGWLHTTTRHTAINAVRLEARRRAREHEAFIMQNISALPDAHWEQLRPILDEAVSHLRERDRQAVLLRFFNGLSHQEVGTVLGLTENSAQKCVDRALEKLRAYFARRGVTVSAALLTTVMSANSVQAAPAGLAADVAKTSTLGASSSLSLGSAFLIAFYMSTKIKTVVAVVVIAVVLGGGCWWFNKRGASTPEKIVQTATQAKADESKLATPVAQVEPPKLPSAPSTSVDPAPASADPQADLKTAIADIARLYRANDVDSVRVTYTPPDQLAAVLSASQYMEQQVAGHPYPGLADPETQKMDKEMQDDAAQSWEALEKQTPVYNAAGDEATYVFVINAPVPPGKPPFQRVVHQTFIKINGKWYLKGEPTN